MDSEILCPYGVFFGQGKSHFSIVQGLGGGEVRAAQSDDFITFSEGWRPIISDHVSERCPFFYKRNTMFESIGSNGYGGDQEERGGGAGQLAHDAQHRVR